MEGKDTDKSVGDDKKLNKEELNDYVAQLKFSCNVKKVKEDCDRLGQMLESAFLDYAAAFKVYEKNCNDNDFGASCHSLGDYYYTGCHRSASDRDFKSALESYEKGCDQHFSPSCIQAGRILILDRNLRDIKRGGDFFERGCNGGSGEACVLAAHLFQYGRRGFDAQPVRALECAIKACDMDYAGGCKSASEMYMNGAIGVPKDWDQYNYYRKKHNLLEKLKKLNK